MERNNAAKDAKPSGGSPSRPTPKVWRREAGAPRFARVYVGDGNSLDLVSVHVDVKVEGPRSRTVVDHVFRNPHARQLEGSFEYPMPSGASPSYFAMFLGQSREAVPPRFARRGAMPAGSTDALVDLSPDRMMRQVDTTDWGRLQEARVVGKEKALETYEDVVRGRVDPALLEFAGGNTFRGRVFPIPPSGYTRVVLAYEELLPISNDRMIYRFPLPGCLVSDLQVTLAAGPECREPQFLPKGAIPTTSADSTHFTRTWNNEKADGEVLFTAKPADAGVQSISGRDGENGPHYVYARIRPDLKKVATTQAGSGQALFLLDTSLSEHPARFDVSMKLLKKILEGDATIKQFNVLAFNLGAVWVEPSGWLPNTPAGRETLFKRLDGVVLEGATDVGGALDKLAEFKTVGDAKSGPVDCFLLSDAHATWGRQETAALVGRFEARCSFPTRFHCYRTGLGAENGELYEALTRRGGGVFNCFNEHDLVNAAAAHRSQCLQVESVRFVGGPETADVLVAGRRAAVYPGGELIVAGRAKAAGRTSILVEGRFLGEKFAQEYPLEIRDGADLAPRGWAELAVANLLALNDPKLDPLVTAYCQQFGVASRVASFLILENEADYKRLNLEEERGKTLAGDLGKFVEQAWSAMGLPATAKETFLRFLDRVEAHRGLFADADKVRPRQLTTLLTDKDFEVDAAPIAGALLHLKDVAADYLAARDRDRFDATTYLTESRRRANAGDVDGAVRALSSVIEVHPTRGDALRLVGYRLLDLKQPAQAAQLFEQVQQQRPFEPHSYRDLALSLEKMHQFGLAAVQYEIILAGTWHNRFGPAIKIVAEEEYGRMMRDAIRQGGLAKNLLDYFGERLEHMKATPQSDLRVTISWNTDATDVDLWVIEPDGVKCFYQNTHTPSGGELSQDQTQGYGPERYQVARALKGKYRIFVDYFNMNPNLLAGETHVNVVVTRFAGSPQETTERHTVILKKNKENVEVCGVEF